MGLNTSRFMHKRYKLLNKLKKSDFVSIEIAKENHPDYYAHLEVDEHDNVKLADITEYPLYGRTLKRTLKRSMQKKTRITRTSSTRKQTRVTT